MSQSPSFRSVPKQVFVLKTGLAILLMLSVTTASRAGGKDGADFIEADVCVYAATPSGILAAVAVKRQGWEWLFPFIDTNQGGKIDEAEYKTFQQYKVDHPDWHKTLREKANVR